MFDREQVDRGNQNINDNMNVNPDQHVEDISKADALGVPVESYRANRDAYYSRATQDAINLVAAGPVMREFYSDREKQALIASDLPEFDRLDFTEKVLATINQGWNQYEVNLAMAEAGRAAERYLDPVGAVMNDDANAEMDEQVKAKMADKLRTTFGDAMQHEALKDLQAKAKELAVANQYANVVKSPKVMAQWDEAKGWDESVRAFMSDPLTLIGWIGGTSFAQQFAPMMASVPGFALSPFVGAATAAAGSAYTEYWASFADQMREQGVDLNDKQQITEFLMDPEMLAAADEFSRKRAGGVSLWDAGAALVAATPMRMFAGMRGIGRQIGRAARGRSAAPLAKQRVASVIDAIAKKNPTLSKFDSIFTQTAVGGVMGGAGEYTAQQAAGQETSWGDIFLEAIGEFFTMPGEIASAQAGIALNYAAQTRRAAVAKKAADVVAGLAQVANVSKLRVRDPKVFQETIKSMGENGNLKEVYVDAGNIDNELAQTMIDLVPELKPAIEEARKTGGVVTIPMDALLTSLSGDMKVIQGLKDHIKISQDGMSAADADKWVKENKNFMNRHFDAVLNAQLQKDEFRRNLTAATAPLESQLNAALKATMAKRYVEEGVMNEKEANKRADEVTTHSMRLFRAQVARMSAMAGMSPKDFMERYPNQVKAVYEAMEANLANEIDQRVSPAKFSDVAISKGLAEDHRYSRKYASIEDMKRSEKSFGINLSIMESIPGMKGAIKRLRNPEKKTEAIIERMVDNLLWIYSQMPEAVRNRARLWYEGGHKSVMLWADRYGIKPRQTAAILAVFSPRNNWFNNFTNAERTMDIYFSDARDFKPDDKLKAKLKELCAGKDEFRYTIAENKSLGEILETDDLRTAAIWIRAYDEVFHDQRVRVQTPEGGVGNDWYRTDKGTLKKCTWMDYHPIIKALSILRDGSMSNIDAQLGDEFKVRDFYNNLYDPTDDQAMTIDTHQVGANLLSVMSSKSREVEQNFGGTGASSSSETGQRGTYAFYAEALSRAAERVGVMPREMQSISWEGIRVLFEDTKKKALRPKVEAIWNRHDKGEITLEQARQEILEVAGGFAKYTWEDTPFNDVPQPSYERGAVNLVHRQEVVPEPVLAIEAAPDPRNAEAVAKWDELTPDEKYIVTKNVVSFVLDRVALATKTRISEAKLQIGGWHGDAPKASVNFSAVAEIADGGDAVAVAKMVAKLLHQEGVFIISGSKQDGLEASKLITIKLPLGITPEAIGDFYLNYIDSVTDDSGKPLVNGMSSSDGFMRIALDASSDSGKIYDALFKSIDGYPGDVEIIMSDAYVGFVTGDANAGSESSQDVSEGLAAARNDHYDPLQGQVDQYFNEQVERAKAARQEVTNAQLDQSVLSLSQTQGESGTLSGTYREGTSGYADNGAAEFNQTIGIRGATIRALRTGNASAIREFFKAKALDGVLSPSEIKRLTGWEKGADNKWRYEILDGVLFKPANKWDLGKPFDLKNVYNAPDLYKAYPWIGGYGIGFVRDEGSDAAFYRDHNTIIINLNKAEAEAEESDGALTVDDVVRNSIIHEVAHVIQRVEGFSSGTNVVKESVPFVRFMKEIGATISEMGNWQRNSSDVENYFATKAPKEVVDRLNSELKRRGYASLQQFLELNLPAARYTNALGEIGARNDEERAGMTIEERRNKLFDETDGIAPEYKFMVEHADNELRQSAWHGSPHIFDEFSTSFIGSGEGAQAHGWGLYFAKNRSVAEGYRSRLTNDINQTVEILGVTIDPDSELTSLTGRDIAIDAIKWALTLPDGSFDTSPITSNAISSIQYEAESMLEEYREDNPDLSDEIDKALEIIDKLKPEDVKFRSVGRLFNVEIPENDVLLNEDLPLDKQPELVRKAIEKIVLKLNAKPKSLATPDNLESIIDDIAEKAVTRGLITGDKYSVFTKALAVFMNEQLYGTTSLDAMRIANATVNEDILTIETSVPASMALSRAVGAENLIQVAREKSQFSLVEIDEKTTGWDIYRELVKRLGSSEAASKLLNENGIKGIAYDGRLDGECFVIFDDKAVQVLEFLQKQEQQAKRQATYNPSENVTRLFKLADESSFIHESGHYWLNTLSLMADRKSVV